MIIYNLEDLVQQKMLHSVSSPTSVCCYQLNKYDIIADFQLAEKFESVIDEPMKNLGYCCGQRPIFRPLVMYCFSHQSCTIPMYGVYYNYEDM
jgi:hypothetical protein